MHDVRAAALMVLAMAFFSLEDVTIKFAAGTIPQGQILTILGFVGGLIFWGMLARKGHRLLTRVLLNPLVIARNICEALGAIGFVLAFTMGDLSSASAIIQAIPLLMAMGAAFFFGETVGWRRWSAIFVGLIGVILVLQPGLDSFKPEALLALMGAAALAGRDLLTRKLPENIQSDQLASSAFFTIAVIGPLMLWVMNDPVVIPDWQPLTACIIATFLGMAGYSALIWATRHGTIAVVAPFRYSRLVFGMIMGIIFFGERPNGLTYLGSLIIVSAGIYTIWREYQVKRASPR